MVTGGAGFIGSTLVRRLLGRPDVGHLVVFDKLTYAGRLENLPDDGRHPRVTFIHGDVTDRAQLAATFREYRISGVFHLAAESHVDRSIEHPEDFIATNVTGTANVIDACRAAAVPLLVCSTDEVYGSVEPPARFHETSPLAPSSPYSASKASADLLALAAGRTYGQDIVITRGSNTYGPRQYPEKLIPLMVRRALCDEPLPVYGSGLQVRDWIHADDHAEGMIAAYLCGGPGEIYHLGGECERANITLVLEILRLLGKPESLVRHVADRPGHDTRYALDCSKSARELGWKAVRPFETCFPQVIRELAAEAGQPL
jgi:dTDP-glucose 4,6-dehydratase